ncbi:hypothetical protein BASA82_000698 [Batrachochytrium salamandrivorans]|uniref:Uncharacterized protein n=1 Tax=Batrachochytrium salamandrivorans TaxID=1357716 RepID=A0ABQ8FD56_9FUNG|nr:hypothetical protein BASA62_005841 [Batrachochytrium salamandrivorans]KAH6579903.1 hypothetical protein BASA60_003071 [Batrachochytrium salamandrivorans]KAH6589915.1 hypothetical protein BASA61_005457 [Batrachochytrium salamandrivorans]KAH6594702.1 hypothetical protein BASA50_006378 [Batrachochytrium salamandrivorans]KAH9257549.1 hypothetical protein BASA81_004312 [Batrachochytrium salamandrivorans]
MSTAFARTALRARAPAQLVRGGHKVSAWGPIHFERVNWVGYGAIPFGVRNPFIFRTVLWTLSAIFFGLPFYSVERKVWPLRVAAWEAEKAKKDSEDN